MDLKTHIINWTLEYNAEKAARKEKQKQIKVQAELESDSYHAWLNREALPYWMNHMVSIDFYKHAHHMLVIKCESTKQIFEQADRKHVDEAKLAKVDGFIIHHINIYGPAELKTYIHIDLFEDTGTNITRLYELEPNHPTYSDYLRYLQHKAEEVEKAKKEKQEKIEWRKKREEIERKHSEFIKRAQLSVQARGCYLLTLSDVNGKPSSFDQLEILLKVSNTQYIVRTKTETLLDEAKLLISLLQDSYVELKSVHADQVKEIFGYYHD